jgi:hypothetical protein
VITGVHLLLNSSNPEADRAFFRDVLKFPYVDAGEGWLIFALPPAEMGVHPAEKSGHSTPEGKDLAASVVFLMCDNLRDTLDGLAAQGVKHGEITDAGWGQASSIPLPGGSSLGLYEPYHRMATSITEVRRRRNESAS